MTPCVEVYMANISSGITLIWGVKVLHTYVYTCMHTNIIYKLFNWILHYKISCDSKMLWDLLFIHMLWCFCRSQAILGHCLFCSLPCDSCNCGAHSVLKVRESVCLKLKVIDYCLFYLICILIHSYVKRVSQISRWLW